MTEKMIEEEINKLILGEETVRRDVLYSILCEEGDKTTPQFVLYAKMSGYYPALAGERFHDTTARVIMSADISAINRDPQYKKIIVSTRRGVKIANKEEARSMISARHAAAMRELHDLQILTEKFDRDGQKDTSGETRSAVCGGAV